MKEINEIKSQIGTLKAKIYQAEKRLEAAGLRYLGVEIGEVIQVNNRGKWFDASVTGCDARYGEPKLSAFKMKIDGTVGQQSAGYISTWRKKDAQANDT